MVAPAWMWTFEPIQADELTIARGLTPTLFGGRGGRKWPTIVAKAA